MDIFFLQLVVLFVPGIVWERIDNRCGVNRPQAQFDIVRRAFGFGLSAYALCYAVIVLANIGWRHAFGHALYAMQMAVLTKDTYTLDTSILWQTCGVTAASLLFATAWVVVTNRKWPIRFMQWIGATKRYGDEDVWDYTFNSRDAASEYVHVRDLENNLTWAGWVDLFSETGRTRELALRDVEVRENEGGLLYSVPRVYLARSSDAITIEFPYTGDQGVNNDEPTGATDPDGTRRLHHQGPEIDGGAGQGRPERADLADRGQTTTAAADLAPDAKSGR